MFASLLIPLLLLGGLELGLRFAGFGYPTSFFLKRRNAGRDVLIDNPKFGWRFFPKSLARASEPLAISADKPDGTCRIFILGESAALGDPEPAFGFGRILGILLQERYTNSRIEVVNVAMTAINSHVILPIARDCARAKGDLWVVYMGNNEVVGPFGAGTVFGPQVPALALIRANLGLKTTRAGQWLDELLGRNARNRSLTQSWGGMEMFVRQQVRQEDVRMPKVYENFQRNLSDILRVLDGSGAKVILCTVAVNLKDCPPFSSLHRDGFSGGNKSAWDELFASGVGFEARGAYAEALEQYLQATRLDDRFAELQFRLGHCHWVLGNRELARRSYELARDLDALRFRADSRINGIIRAEAAGKRGAGVYLVDASDALARQSAHEIPGEELFYEHVHLNFEGNYWLARSVAEQAAQILPEKIAPSRGSNEVWATAEHCAQRLALTDWNKFQVLEEVRRRVSAAPFTNQVDHLMREQRLQSRLEQLTPADPKKAFRAAREDYQKALGAAPEDSILHANFARLLAASGDIAAAIEQWRKVAELLPHDVTAYYESGNLLDRLGKSADAQQALLQALRARPESVEAMNGLGLALTSQEKFGEAIRCYTKALRLKPDFLECRINLGLALANQGKTNEAMNEYTAVLRLDPKSTAAHINLGRILSDQKQYADAAKHYREAVRLRPDHAVAHFNLANASAAQNLRSEALAHYEEAVKLQPDFVAARYHLALEYARQERTREAEEQLLEVLKLKPDDAPAHLNLGVALAQQKRIKEAVDHFREAARLDPANQQAQQYLRAAQSIERQPR